jgi:tetratricopeptide (TPR) repeat protein
LTPLHPYTIIEFYGLLMKAILSITSLTLLLGTPPARAQEIARPHAPVQQPLQSPGEAKTPDDSTRSDVYYYFLMGHMQEQEFELNGEDEQADKSIESYKKALEIEPDSPVIMERLAEIYSKSKRIHEAVIEAQAALKIDPDNLDAHRLLARIYVRTLGDLSTGDVQKENIEKAVTQFQAILKIQPDDTYSALWLARLYRFENKHDDAEQVLRGILKHEPDNGPALEQLSQILVDEGRSQDAIALLTQAAGDGSSPDIYDLLGDAYSQEKDYPKAEDAYRKAVAEDPDDVGHLHGLAQALLAQDKYADALEQFKKLSELEPGTFENYVRMAQLYRRVGNFKEAESSLLRAKQLAPGNLEILYNEALLYEDQGRFDDAVKVLSDAIAGIKNPSSTGGDASPNALAILYEQLGRAHEEAQDFPAAIETFQEMAKLGPETEKRAHMLLIEAYKESRDLDRAIAETKKALEESPKDRDLTVTLAMLYGEKTDAEAGTKLLQSLLQGDNNDQEIYLDIAQVNERGRKYSDAEQAAVKAGQMAHAASDKEMVWFLLGAIYEAEKKFDDAEQQFRKVLDENPNNASALNDYGYMLADRGIRLDEAASMIQRALKQEPNNGAYLDSLGWAYYKQNKLAEAEESLRKATDRDSHDPTILGHLAEVYLKMGQTDRAARLMERALAEWQKALPADYEADRVNELDAQLKTLKKRLAQKSTPETAKPQ